MGKKKQADVRFSRVGGFFLSYLQELCLVLQVSESEFYQWVVLGAF